MMVTPADKHDLVPRWGDGVKQTTLDHALWHGLKVQILVIPPSKTFLSLAQKALYEEKYQGFDVEEGGVKRRYYVEKEGAFASLLKEQIVSGMGVDEFLKLKLENKGQGLSSPIKLAAAKLPQEALSSEAVGVQKNWKGTEELVAFVYFKQQRLIALGSLDTTISRVDVDLIDLKISKVQQDVVAAKKGGNVEDEMDTLRVYYERANPPSNGVIGLGIVLGSKLLLDFYPKGSLMEWQKEATTQEVIKGLVTGAKGLKSLVENGIIYTDAKPLNFLVDRDGNLVVADFGKTTYLPQPNDPRPAEEIVEELAKRLPEETDFTLIYTPHREIEELFSNLGYLKDTELGLKELKAFVQEREPETKPFFQRRKIPKKNLMASVKKKYPHLYDELRALDKQILMAKISETRALTESVLVFQLGCTLLASTTSVAMTDYFHHSVKAAFAYSPTRPDLHQAMKQDLTPRQKNELSRLIEESTDLDIAYSLLTADEILDNPTEKLDISNLKRPSLDQIISRLDAISQMKDS